jgi:hypothetical protein
MIQSLSSNANLLHATQMANARMSERPGEAEHDGDSDDAAGAIRNSGGAGANKLPGYLGTMINTTA